MTPHRRFKVFSRSSRGRPENVLGTCRINLLGTFLGSQIRTSPGRHFKPSPGRQIRTSPGPQLGTSLGWPSRTFRGRPGEVGGGCPRDVLGTNICHLGIHSLCFIIIFYYISCIKQAIFLFEIAKRISCPSI